MNKQVLVLALMATLGLSVAAIAQVASATVNGVSIASPHIGQKVNSQTPITFTVNGNVSRVYVQIVPIGKYVNYDSQTIYFEPAMSQVSLTMHYNTTELSNGWNTLMICAVQDLPYENDCTSQIVYVQN